MARGGIIHQFSEKNADFGAVAFSPDTSLLAIADSARRREMPVIRFWDLAADKIVLKIPSPGVRRMRFSPDGMLLAWESEESVSFIEVKSGKDLLSFPAHTGPVHSVTYSPDGKLIATGSADGDVRLWNASTFAPLEVLKGHTGEVLCVAFSPNGQLLVSGSADDTAVVWDVATGRQKWHLEDQGNRVTSVAFSPDGKVIATGGYSGETFLWSAETGKQLESFKEKESCYPAYFPDGNRLVAGGRNSLRIWNLKAGKVVDELPVERIASVAVSSDGKLLAAGCGEHTYVWAVEKWKRVATLPGMHNFECGVAFSPDNSLLAFASDGLWSSEKHNVHLWDTKTWKDVSPIRFPLQRYTSVAFSPDGRYLTTGSVHAEALVWDLKPKR